MFTRNHRRRIGRAGTAAIASAAAAVAVLSPASAGYAAGAGAAPTTPIKHLVVIFQENVSFDHYFGTYPQAANTDGQRFTARSDTPQVNGLTDALLTHNPNSANPQRLSPADQPTCDQDHGYTAEQQAFDHGLMDKFVQFTNSDTCAPPLKTKPNLVMDYYDGNTVTGLWNYAQHFAMSDNSYGTTFGPSTPGALNLVAGQTHGAAPSDLSGNTQNGSVIGDPDPVFDDCSGATRVSMSGRNVGNLLSDKGVSWGWFEGGFARTNPGTAAPAQCLSAHKNIAGLVETDYSPHHNPFEYYASTSNPHHLPPASAAEIGHDGQANHQYDLTDFDTALDRGQLPAVSFLKAARFQDGHPANSDPADEQNFLVNTINKLQHSKDWKSTAVVISYDDSDGWYDHQMSPIVNASQSTGDALSGPGQCGTNAPLAGFQDRCGYGPRLPLLVISPFSRVNSVDHHITDQSSILRFIEDNWQTGRIGDGSFDTLAGSLAPMFDFKAPKAPRLFLDPRTGQPARG